MPRLSPLWLLMIASLSTVSTARAASPFLYTISFTTSPAKCAVNPAVTPAAADKDQLQVKVVDKTGKALIVAGTDLTITMPGPAGSPITVGTVTAARKGGIFPEPAGTLSGQIITIKQTAGSTVCDKLPTAPKAVVATDDSTDGVTDGSTDGNTDADGTATAFSGWDDQAIQWLADDPRAVNNDASDAPDRRTWLQGQTQVVANQMDGYRAAGREITIYHLPDGSPAFPVPLHITEKDRIVIKVVVPAGASVAADVTTCDAARVFRILGTYADAAKVGPLVATHGAQEPVTGWVVKTLGRILNCAGSLVYKISVTYQGKTSTVTTTIPIDPIYRLSWGAGVMYDFGHPVQLALASRPASSGTGTEQYVTRTSPSSAFRPIVTLGFHMCGMDPNDWNPCDLIVPFAGVDLTRLTTGFLWGLEFMAPPGIGIVTGMSIYESDILNAGSNVTPGSVYSTTGALPKTSVFNDSGLGFMLGLEVTSDILAKLVPTPTK